MPIPNEKGECRCGGLAQVAQDPTCPVEFDARLNEYHITHTIENGGGYSVVNFCPFCGGSAPKSLRGSLTNPVSDAEQQRLTDLTKGLRTMADVIAAFGEPDPGPLMFRHITILPEKEGMPKTTERCPIKTYSKLSEEANVHVTVYPTDKIDITFRRKPTLITQTHQTHLSTPNMNVPEAEPQIDASKRYDVYCAEPHQRIVVYRNALFKGAGNLPSSPVLRGAGSQYIGWNNRMANPYLYRAIPFSGFASTGAVSTAETVVAK